MAATRSDFYPRPPRGGRPGPFRWPFSTPGISIHALREEGDRCSGQAAGPAADFYPRPPRGGRRLNGKTQILPLKFLSTPSARRATLLSFLWPITVTISIHALREEGDSRSNTRNTSSLRFLSTPSARRATSASLPCRSPARFLSTPSARRATYLLTVPPTSIKISIHALREEGDDVGVDDVVHIARFLSTPSARRATRASSTATSTCSYFYPRPPRGGRLVCAKNKTPAFVFLSTPSARRATPQRR